MSDELAGLYEAAKILENAKGQTYMEPMAIYALVNHASNHINARLAAVLRGDND